MSLLAALIVAASGTAAMLPPAWSALCPPKSRPDEIVVCATRDPASPYRAPLPGPRTFGERGTASPSAERNQLLGPIVGTIGNCSTWGPGGLYGCGFKEFKENVNQAAGSRDPRGRLYEKRP